MNHSIENCQCRHAAADHDSKIVCHRCEHVDYVKERTLDELAGYADLLAGQAEQFIEQFEVDLSGAETFAYESEARNRAENAYARIAEAQKQVDLNRWERAKAIEEGRNGKDIMDPLWDVCDEFRLRAKNSE